MLKIVFDPDGLLAEWKERSFALPALIVLISAVISSFTAYTTAPVHSEAIKKALIENGFSEEQAEAVAKINFYSSILMAAIMTFIVWFIITAVLYGISALFDGKGSFKILLKLVAFSYIPNIAASPINLYIAKEEARIISVYGLEGLGSLNPTIVASVTLSIVVAIWQAVYWTFAVRHARELELRKAAITSAILLAIVVVIEMISLALLAIHGRTY